MYEWGSYWEAATGAENMDGSFRVSSRSADEEWRLKTEQFLQKGSKVRETFWVRRLLTCCLALILSFSFSCLQDKYFNDKEPSEAPGSLEYGVKEHRKI